MLQCTIAREANPVLRQFLYGGNSATLDSLEQI
jgi:hypothetical protein